MGDHATVSDPVRRQRPTQDPVESTPYTSKPETEEANPWRVNETIEVTERTVSDESVSEPEDQP